jgi:hypothetical protein
MRYYFTEGRLDLRKIVLACHFTSYILFKSIKFLSGGHKVVLDITTVNLVVVNCCSYIPPRAYFCLDSEK